MTELPGNWPFAANSFRAFAIAILKGKGSFFRDEEPNMAASNHNEEVIQWLGQRGHTPEEIAKIQAKLAAYDEIVVRDALFDSMNSGAFDINSVIKEALKHGH
ncbi:MAG TPA: hypothetical protein VGP68_09430 [Gemmataceae bacterium]|nr:hypothetical protein [Gemmataceae bacterium]